MKLKVGDPVCLKGDVFAYGDQVKPSMIRFVDRVANCQGIRYLKATNKDGDSVTLPEDVFVRHQFLKSASDRG